MIFERKNLKYIKYHYDSQKYYISGFGIELFGPMPGTKYSKNRIKCCDNSTGKYLSKIQKMLLVWCVIFYSKHYICFKFIKVVLKYLDLFHILFSKTIWNFIMIFLSSNSNSKKVLVEYQLSSKAFYCKNLINLLLKFFQSTYVQTMFFSCIITVIIEKNILEMCIQGFFLVPTYKAYLFLFF